MTEILCDTDILSVFAKIDRLNLLDEAFPGAEFLIVEEVYNELKYAESNGFSFPEKAINKTDITPLEDSELEDYRDLKDRAKFFPLSKADLKTFVAAESRKLLLISNDSHLLEVADQEEVLALDIYDVLKILYEKDKVDESDLEGIAQDTLREDNLKLKDIDRIT